MSALTAGLLGAASLILFAALFVAVRRAERDLDYSAMTGGRRDDKLPMLARVVANVIVSSP
ncbi:MAG TPA: hypothetical protein VFU35_08895 [Jatrophihabitans sp.]|nr:hypothetical protein [Jatrophihabitans sp.]